MIGNMTYTNEIFPDRELWNLSHENFCQKSIFGFYFCENHQENDFFSFGTVKRLFFSWGKYLSFFETTWQTNNWKRNKKIYLTQWNPRGKSLTQLFRSFTQFENKNLYNSETHGVRVHAKTCKGNYLTIKKKKSNENSNVTVNGIWLTYNLHSAVSFINVMFM